VKLLGSGEISMKLTIRVHAISASAREKIEQAGGTIELLREPKERKVRHHAAKPEAAAEEPEEQTDDTADEAAPATEE
jgi:hypothetical protein